MGRNIAAVVVGIVVVGVVVGLLQWMISQVFPLPEGLDPFDPASAETLAEHMASQPPTMWLMALASELIGVFLAALAAGTIATHRKPVIGIIVALGLVGSIINWISFTHPIWFIVIQLIAYPALFFAAVAMVGPRGEEPA